MWTGARPWRWWAKKSGSGKSVTRAQHRCRWFRARPRSPDRSSMSGRRWSAPMTGDAAARSAATTFIFIFQEPMTSLNPLPHRLEKADQPESLSCTRACAATRAGTGDRPAPQRSPIRTRRSGWGGGGRGPKFPAAPLSPPKKASVRAAGSGDDRRWRCQRPGSCLVAERAGPRLSTSNDPGSDPRPARGPQARHGYEPLLSPMDLTIVRPHRRTGSA